MSSHGSASACRARGRRSSRNSHDSKRRPENAAAASDVRVGWRTKAGRVPSHGDVIAPAFLPGRPTSGQSVSLPRRQLAPVASALPAAAAGEAARLVGSLIANPPQATVAALERLLTLDTDLSPPVVLKHVATNEVPERPHCSRTTRTVAKISHVTTWRLIWAPLRVTLRAFERVLASISTPVTPCLAKPLQHGHRR